MPPGCSHSSNFWLLTTGYWILAPGSWLLAPDTSRAQISPAGWSGNFL